MKITLLGTGTSLGVPIIGCDCPVCNSKDPRDNRLRSSALVEWKNQVFLIDAGPDFRQQMLRTSVRKIDAILLTHEHKDHVSGLDDIRALNFLLRKPIDIYAEKRVQDSIRKNFAYVFSMIQYPGIPQMNLHQISPGSFEINGLKIITIRAFHYKLPILGFRFGDFTYISDTNYIPPEQMAKISGTRILVLNALRWEAHLSHNSIPEAIKLIQEIKPERTYLTHLSHQAGKYEDLIKELPAGVEPGYDGLVIYL
ncbi:MAG: MBL fold metallo-hydrolase [Porphyromonadaceae bacterium]|nr:MAG: MBL fold metallo-hydrolase [Porphyromonadaceae bacterium]